MELGIYSLTNNDELLEQKHSELVFLKKRISEIVNLKIPLKLKRLYCGTEFCERPFPSHLKLKNILRKAKYLGLELSFVTPVMTTQVGIKKFKSLFEFLNGKGRFEVIINSWGVLELIQEFHNLEPVLGRNLTKIKRDPRVNYNYPPFKESLALRQCSLTNPSFIYFLKNYRIKKIELDNVPQGLKMNFHRMNLRAHLYFPTIPITFSKLCLLGSMNRKRHRFAIDGPCQKECQNYTIVCQGEINRSEKDICLFADFHAEFVGRGVYMLNKNLNRINLCDFHRIIFCY